MPPASDRAMPAAEQLFIGRTKELAVFDEALDLACAGQGRLVMLAGPPGIGKTRTAQQVAVHAAARGMRALWGRCPEAPGAPPYWPWLQMLRKFVSEHDAEAVRTTAGAATPYLASLDPNLAAQLPPHDPPPACADAAHARFRLFDAVAGFWQRAAANRPLLLVLDDLHCADVPSLRLLEFTAGETAASRILLFGTYRDAEITRTHPLADTLGALARLSTTVRVTLAGFTAAETAQFVAAVSGEEAPGLASTLHERTEGHPLFLAEMTRLLQARRTRDNAASGAVFDLTRVPAGIREVIASRLNRVSAPCSELLGTAAVIGRRFEIELLAQLLDGSGNDQCLDLLDEARRASLIEAMPEPAGWQFTHVLIRDALYDEMPTARRHRLHHRIATALERMHGDEPACLSALAYHWQAAHSVESAAKAAQYATRAAQHADATLAYEEAAQLYRRALQVTAPERTVERCGLLLALGNALLKAAEHEAAIDAFNNAAKIARQINAPAPLAQAALGYETASWRSGNTVGPVAVALLKEALAANSPLDSPQRAQLLAALCRALVYSDRVDAAVAIHGQAVQMARRLGDTAVLFAALGAIVPARWRPDLRPLRLAAGREAMQLAQRAGNAEWAAGHLTGWHVGDLIEAGDFESAVRAAEFGPDLDALAHQPYVRAVFINCRAMLALHAGRFAEGDRLAAEAMRQATQLAHTTGAAAVQLFTLRREQGRLAELAPVLEQFQRNVSDDATWQPGYIVLCCELGRREQAQAAFERLAAKQFDLGPPSSGARSGSLVYLAEACAWLGDTARAEALYALLAPYAGGGIVFGAHVASLGSADRVLGMLARTMQRWDDAEMHFERAIAFDEASSGRPWLARSRFEYAGMLLARGQSGDAVRARALLDAALASARELGMPALEQQVLALQAKAGAHDPYPAGLTIREVQVLCMVAEGRSNQEIANSLFRSVNTVANHVRHILAKIGAANRTEAAAFAARHGLLKRP